MPLRIAITAGEPAGIGPELIVRLAQESHNHELVVVADPALLVARAKLLGLELNIQYFDPDSPARVQSSRSLTVCPIPLAEPSIAGQLNSRNSQYVVNTLAKATELCREGHCQALVTAPVQKSIINEAGIPFSGHTEFLAEQTGTPRVVMMLAHGRMRVALVTTHLPLRAVPDAITKESFGETLRILHTDLQRKFGIDQPRIMVLGLNPHSGEGGYLGREEIDIINPVLKDFRDRGMLLTPALPADTAFTQKHLSQCDAVLAMYHDQGLPVLKYSGFGKSINITLGLPFVRTSVDHGTALDLAGTGKAKITSLKAALQTAIEMASSSKA